MPNPEYERQRRYYDRHIKTGAIRRLECRLPIEDYMLIKHLAAHWDCSLTAVVTRSVQEAWAREGKPTD